MPSPVEPDGSLCLTCAAYADGACPLVASIRAEGNDQPVTACTAYQPTTPPLAEKDA